MEFYGKDDGNFGGGSSSTAALEKSFATGAKSISDNNLVGINANNISMILESLNKYREGINNEVLELADKSLEAAFGQNILDKLREYVSKITDLCIDFLNAYEPFSVKLDYVREVYEKEKQKQKDQVGGVVTGNGVVVVDGEIKASYLKGADKVSAGYSNPLEQVKVISSEAIPEAGMTMDEVIDYWSRQGRLGNGDERKKKC